MENTKLLRKLKFIIILAFIIFISIAASNIFGKGWIFYNDGPYRGKVVDADNGEPIEGAVVVGMWKLEAYGGPAAPSEPYCDAQETITTKNGEFIVPKASCFFLWPFTKMGMAELVIFKPGYLSYPPLGYNQEQRKTYMPDFTGDEFKDEKQYYIIKLGKPKTREERELIQSHAQSPLTDETISKLPILIKLVNEERKNIGLDEVYKEGNQK